MQNLSVRQHFGMYTVLHFGIHFFIGLYLFNTATDQFLVMLPSLIYANLVKICQSVNILVYTFLHFGIHFFIIGLYLFNTATDQVYFWHACTLGPGLYSPTVFGDAALINLCKFNLCKFGQNHIKCSYFLIS